ncbi:MAG: beta-galactosidase, partial [Proteiniphilum sp.]
MNRIKISLNVFLIFLTSLGCKVSSSGKSVPPSRMEAVYEEVKTPHKYGLVIAPQSNQEKMDCPTVFRRGDKWYMTYLRYDGKSGKDGRGYETWLAESDNLLEWTTLGRLLSFRDGKWDENQRGGYPSLIDHHWSGSYELNSYDDKYWMTYIGGAETGYETGPLKIGVAYTEKDPTVAHEWKAFNEPVMSPEEKDAQWFENIIQYKSSVFRDDNETFGKPFVMFYNAGGINPENDIKAERVGIAYSDDMVKWERYPG